MSDYQTIERAPSRDKFTVIENLAIRDKRISFRARGIHHLLLSYADGWEVNVSHLVSQSPEGKGEQRDGILSALKELEMTGYLTRSQKRSENGTFQKGKYVVHELPVNGSTVNGSTVNGSTVNGSTVNGSTDAYINNNSIGITEFNHHQHQESDDADFSDFQSQAIAAKAANLAKKQLAREKVKESRRDFIQDSPWGDLAEEMKKDPQETFNAFKSHLEACGKSRGKDDPVAWGAKIASDIWNSPGSELNNPLWLEFAAAYRNGKTTQPPEKTEPTPELLELPELPEPSPEAKKKLRGATWK